MVHQGFKRRFSPLKALTRRCEVAIIKERHAFIVQGKGLFGTRGNRNLILRSTGHTYHERHQIAQAEKVKPRQQASLVHVCPPRDSLRFGNAES